MFTVEEKRELVDSYKPWWHSIDFGDGVVSKGIKTKEIHNFEVNNWFPSDFFSNKRVLDIGTWDGYYAFNAERMGASEVVAVDKHVWNVDCSDNYDDGNKRSKRGFDTAKKILQSNVKDFILDIHEMKPEILGTFDSIIFAGVFYHLKDPLISLEILDSLLNKGGRAMIETEMRNNNINIPLMQFFPKNSLNNDSSNFFAPNASCLKKMIEEVGDYSIESLKPGNRGTMVARKNS